MKVGFLIFMINFDTGMFFCQEENFNRTRIAIYKRARTAFCFIAGENSGEIYFQNDGKEAVRFYLD